MTPRFDRQHYASASTGLVLGLLLVYNIPDRRQQGTPAAQKEQQQQQSKHEGDNGDLKFSSHISNPVTYTVSPSTTIQSGIVLATNCLNGSSIRSHAAFRNWIFSAGISTVALVPLGIGSGDLLPVFCA
ncbi:hypothetical protein Vadar_028576 [Vaccinium darrowii]|uniref:Uncharacterized protein n=1 Tax=Vaccinium darrowii TaxID=229202 RepID=A0ACB7YGZ1_9ERIC|nr:hypothetical protein Vadar_028576 [Vaccinium darrowii]